jgi:hypothetical protein
MQHSDLYDFATHYWWLVFPIIWMFAAFGRIITRHHESQRILDMVKTYADQGKEPPAALVEMFKSPRGGRGCGTYVEPYYTHRLWRRVFVFGFLAGAFAVLGYMRDADMPDGLHHGMWHHNGLIIAAVIMAALCAASIGSLLTRPKLPPDQK